jgi:predicted NAD/FAD-dependent oxidoreductase
MKVAIVGAGVSGLSAAYFLLEKDPTLEIELFEKSSALGGRMATRRVMSGALPVDTGCQFLSIDTEQIHDFFMRMAPKESVKELPQSILCLPEGFVVERRHRYFLQGGMTQWSKNLAENLSRRDNFKIHFEKKIAELKDLEGAGFDRLLVTAPGPQGQALGARRAVEYHPCLSLIFSWHKAPREALNHYAYRDISSREGITWLGHEGLKSGNPEIWVAQVSPEKSVEWFEAQHSADVMEDIISEDLARWIPLFEKGEKTFIDSKFWRYAFPIQFGEPSPDQAFERRDIDERRRVYYLGDGYKGVGRTENAIESAISMCGDFFK